MNIIVNDLSSKVFDNIKECLEKNHIGYKVESGSMIGTTRLILNTRDVNVYTSVFNRISIEDVSTSEELFNFSIREFHSVQIM